MSVKMRKFSLVFAAFAVLLLLAAVFSACDSPLGFGDPIDWEAPVLKIDPGTNPRYVRKDTVLTGSVTDNIGVERVILRDAKTLQELFRASISGSRWSIPLEFTDDNNGEKIAVEIVAFDKRGNSGESSIAAISLIIDLTDPAVNDIWITRTSMRRAYLEPWVDLQQLENGDEKGELIANADKYQNGWFYIDARLSEDETKIDRVKLQIYDSRHPDEPMLLEDEDLDPGNPPLFEGKKRDEGSTVTAPRWLIKEEDIIARGAALWGESYKTDYYQNGKRYYYQVAVIAHDKSKNEGKWKNETQNFFVMWENADRPKGILDPMIVGASQNVTITKGELLPVDFFDDDSLGWAYADLFTREQWNGYRAGVGVDYATGTAVFVDEARTLRMPNGDDTVKLNWLKQQLVDNHKTLINWKNDKAGYVSKDKNIKELLGGKSPDEKSDFIQTGTNDDDFGEFVLFTLVQDKKLAPHPTTPAAGAPDTNKDRWIGRIWNVQIVDDSQPMIVFDTEDRANKNGSPEENTFPILDQGRYFTIHGYTLRQSKTGADHSVSKLRMAWIPYGSSASEQAGKVNAALVALKDTAETGVNSTTGVQYWDLTLYDDFGCTTTNAPEYEIIGSGPTAVRYRKQYFSKTFDILGGSAANPTTGIALAGSGTPPTILKNPITDSSIDEPHFVYKNQLENETKLFVLVAVDDMGHDVNKQLPLLGRKTPPNLTVYDLSDREASITLTPPNVSDYASQTLYQAALLAYNQDSDTFDAIKNIADSSPLDDKELADSLQIYPRGKTLRYWVLADKIGDLAIQSIKMIDRTYDAGVDNIGNYDADSSRLSYVEFMPDVSQRGFVFTATDTLGNIAQLQRTATITSTSMLTDISTPKPSGTYGISVDTDDTITLFARFSGMIQWEGNGADFDNAPLLNVRYQNHPNGTYVVEQIKTITPRMTPTLSLEFRFSVPENAIGKLETMYEGMTDNNSGINRPITLPGTTDTDTSTGTRIMDVGREGSSVPAFIPGYTSGSTRMELWKDEKNSLQDKKNIELDGVRPNLIRVGSNALNSFLPVSGKAAYTTNGGDFYFKGNETITFTLRADKRIQPSGDGNPRIAFYIGNTVSATDTTVNGPYYANYQRSTTIDPLVPYDTMIFTFLIGDNSPARDGVIITSGANAIKLDTDKGGIKDIVGNNVSQFVSSASIPTPVFPTTTNPATSVTIDQGIPDAPPTLLRNGSTTVETVNGENTTERETNENLNVHIGDLNPAEAAYNSPLTKYYSPDDGLTWSPYTGTDGISLGNGTHKIRTRYIDHAGNEGKVSSKTIIINANFPKLIAAIPQDPDGYYTRGTLRFNLEFDAPVRIATANRVSITLRNRNTGDNSDPHRIVTLSQTATTTTYSTTVKFEWTLPAVGTNVNTVKEMLSGLYISAVDFRGLTDRFNNTGGQSAVTAGTFTSNTAGSIDIPLSSTNNTTYATNFNLNGAGIKVDTKTPEISTRSPATAQGVTGNRTASVSSDNKTITLTFNEDVQPGRGTITVRPHGNYAIPPVLESEGYYLTVTYNADGTQTETRSSTKPTTGDSTYISRMNDIYNNMPSTGNDRGYLIGAGTLSSPQLSALTGLSVGPYKRMTQGLKTGAGYTGNYTGTGVNAPTPEATSPHMIPDTATKWVLDYQYEIHATTGAVSNIRDALTRVNFRRQDIVATSTNVAISGKTVIITLNEPLLPGLQWYFFFPEATFTDLAGNPVAALADDNTNYAYWFWSKGIQKPVIRVDRKSYDSRTTAPIRDPSTNDARQTNPTTYTDITAFNTVAYRIETETPGARIYYNTLRGANNTGSTTGAWTGNIVVGGTTYTWGGPKTNNGTTGIWVQPNLIFRNSNNGSFTATENGITVTHNIIGANSAQGGTFATNYYGFRSFNKDALESELSGLGLTIEATNPYVASSFDYSALQASKDYVAAEARIDHDGGAFSATYTSQKGYEGVFRTVIALHQNGLTNATGSYILLLGTNVKSGIPTIAGFPVRDGVATNDTRYLKMFYRNNKQFYWVSTEIVSSWYMQCRGNGSAHSTTAGTNPNGSGYMSSGDSTDWITAGYGDLSYGFDVVTY